MGTTLEEHGQAEVAATASSPFLLWPCVEPRGE